MAKNKWTDLLGTLGRIALDVFVDSKKSNTSHKPKGTTSPRGTGSPVPSKPKASASSSSKKNDAKPESSAKPGPRKPLERTGATPPLSDTYPGDFTGTVTPEYSPALDGDADPGEIVWTWVPYEDDFNQGKDRPTLIVGRDGDWLLGLMLTSKDKSKARYGDWLDIGSGPWDNRGRDSEIRLDRVIRVHPGHMRREGAVMDRVTFTGVVKAMAAVRR